MKKKTFLILDANSILHRAFYALPPLTTKSGQSTNALYGFLLAFFKALKETQPDYIASCFDFPAPTFRHQKFKEYKITRPPTPKDLVSQIKILKEIMNDFQIPVFEKEGFEADDLIGTICNFVSEGEIEKIIVSGDRDVLQLVDKKTKVYLFKKGVKEITLFDEEKVKEEFNDLSPKQLIDFKALVGDRSDNIPGIAGVGPKVALKLIKEFETIENLYKALESENKNFEKKLKKKICNQKEKAILSKQLIEIKKDVPIEFKLEKCKWGNFDEEKVIQTLKKLEFYSLLQKIPEIRQKKELKLF